MCHPRENGNPNQLNKIDSHLRGNDKILLTKQNEQGK
jgi:hypothetical protein